MIIRIIILSLFLCYGSIGCALETTIGVMTVGAIGTAGYGQFLNYGLKKQELELKRERFEWEKSESE